MSRNELAFEGFEPITVSSDSRRYRCPIRERFTPLSNCPRNRSVSFNCPRCSCCSRCTPPSTCGAKRTISPCDGLDGPSFPKSSPCQECIDVSKRKLKSGKVTRDRFSSLCYPSNMPTSRPFTSFQLERSQSGKGNSRRCSNGCPKSCSPTYGLDVTRKQSGRRECQGCCNECPSKYKTNSEKACDLLSPCGDICSPEPSNEFMEATKEAGTCPSRYTPHMCPWEADVAVSGTVRAHCSSTADEVSSRLAGRFKANGKRFTSDSIGPRSTCPDLCAQRLSLGVTENGPRLNLSRNSLRYSDDKSLNERVNRIINSNSPCGRNHNNIKKGIISERQRALDNPEMEGSKWAYRRPSCGSKDNENKLKTRLSKHFRVNSEERYCDGIGPRNFASAFPSSYENVKHSRKRCLKYSCTPTKIHETDYATNNNYEKQERDQRQRFFGIGRHSSCKDKEQFSTQTFPRSSPTYRSTSSPLSDESDNISSLNLDHIHFRSLSKV